MIVVTRLHGGRFAVNPDLVQRVETTPDTVITLVDGTKYIVSETLDELVEAMTDARARVISRAQALAEMDTAPEVRQPLAVVRTPEEAR
ncbi:flagellar FlbD family protein [Sanguibacter massiliensis]|uniref:flagellar FlbD family protein n=1 Tax=Sanguibacter massiliensis TaxID=1973217 RepID=UPI000C82C08B|nr:flagellar FlbD family protein [Sanguibacter massiliensis]